jgi:ubiquinone/menaquinone biosynthesis C-methylase UbiE
LNARDFLILKNEFKGVTNMSNVQAMVCPWWLSFTVNNFARRWIQDPQRILEPFIRTGQVAADIGCGPGFFTLDMARLVGDRGKVIAVDLQQKMLEIVQRRAEKADLSGRIQYQRCGNRELGIPEPCDFILACYMVHEVPDAGSFLKELKSALKPGGLFLLIEPKMHVSKKKFAQTAALAYAAGFRKQAEPLIRFSRAVLLTH